jgi:hypothetical protein
MGSGACMASALFAFRLIDLRVFGYVRLIRPARDLLMGNRFE